MTIKNKLTGGKRMEENLLVIAAETEGFETVMDMLADAMADIQCPGVCSNCKFVEIEVDPDSSCITCDECGQDTLSSVLVLAGLI
jgi:hypothetical protein